MEFLDEAVNRSVLIVRPAEPFKRWSAKTDEAERIDRVRLFAVTTVLSSGLKSRPRSCPYTLVAQESGAGVI
jgi:hypothetical protein